MTIKTTRQFSSFLTLIQFSLIKKLGKHQQAVISLLQLKVTLNDPIQAFKAIYDLIVDSPVKGKLILLF